MKTKQPAVVVLMFFMLVVLLACFCNISPRPELKFDPEELPTGQINIPYEVKIQVSQNVTPVYTMFVSEGTLPGGLTLKYVERDSFATIAGAPSQTGTFKFTITAMCLGTNVSGQVGKREYTIEVR